MAALATPLLAGCNYGAYVAFGPGDDGPNVNLAASPAAAAPGETVGLVAAAQDDYRVVEVKFYRVDGTGSTTLLGSDRDAPYAIETRVPASALDEVRYLAAAVDDADQVSERAVVAVSVR
jgi:hypothetical protein